MTRREFFSIAWAAVVARNARPELTIPIHVVMDVKARLRPEQLLPFWSRIWPEAVRDFARCGMRLETNVQTGEVGRPPGREPVISGLSRDAINMVITDQIPAEWDNGRALCGVATHYRGHRLCVIAVSRAHGNEIPLIAVNTCVHELLHVLLGDIFERRPTGLAAAVREFRIDWYATRMWLLHDGDAVRKAVIRPASQAQYRALRLAIPGGSLRGQASRTGSRAF
jgi:hypothetical protein